MRQVEYTATAFRELAKIARESEASWGSEQRDWYLGEIDRRVRQLLDRPTLGPAHGLSHPGLRRLRVGSHIVFYRFDDARVLVVHVLHQRMDIERRLRGLRR